MYNYRFCVYIFLSESAIGNDKREELSDVHYWEKF